MISRGVVFYSPDTVTDEASVSLPTVLCTIAKPFLKVCPSLPCRSAPPCCASQQAPAHRQHLQHLGGPLQCFQRTCCQLTGLLCHTQTGRCLADTERLCLWQTAQGASSLHSNQSIGCSRPASANGSAAPPHCAAALSAGPASVPCRSQGYATGQWAASASHSSALHVTAGCPVFGAHLCCVWVGGQGGSLRQLLPCPLRPPACRSVGPCVMCLCYALQVYVTGHGGEDFLKFQDKGEMQSSDLADAIHKVRHRHILPPAHHASRVTWRPAVRGCWRGGKLQDGVICMHAVRVTGTGWLRLDTGLDMQHLQDLQRLQSPGLQALNVSRAAVYARCSSQGKADSVGQPQARRQLSQPAFPAACCAGVKHC